MLSLVQDKSVQLLETIIERLEKIDQLHKRPRVYAQAASTDDDAHSSGSQDGHATEDGSPTSAKDKTEKLKQLGFELIDIGLHTSQLTLEMVQQSAPYQNLQEGITTLEQKVADKKVQLYKFISDKVVTPLTSNLYVIYDKSQHVLSFLMEVILEHQQKVKEYLARNYENVTVIIRDNWLRLDFNKDGHVSIEDIKKGAQELLEFLRNFDYLSAATEIKSSLYQEAIKYMKKEVSSEGASQVELQPLQAHADSS